MYIPYQSRQAIHQDIVNGGLTRSDRKRMLRERETETGVREGAWNPGTTLTALVRSLVAMVARP